MIDLGVVGGGPVGLATAIHARRAGLSVVVFEPRSAPVDKACGEGLMPSALAHLHRIGVDPAGQSFVGIRYISGGRSAVARFRSGPGRGVRRTVLHAALHARAVDVGVDFLPERVAAMSPTHSGIAVAGVEVRYLVGADGLHSNVRRLAGLAAPAPAGPPRFGVRRHYRVAPWTDLVEVHWLAGSELYVTPVGDALVGVALLGSPPLDLDDAIAQSSELAAHLAGREPVGDDRGAGALRQSSTRRTAGRVLLVGDAAGYVDALTGEGIRIGLDEAAAAVDAVVRQDLAGYERRWRAITRSYRVLTASLLAVACRPRARRLVVPAAARLPGVFARIVDEVGG